MDTAQYSRFEGGKKTLHFLGWNLRNCSGLMNFFKEVNSKNRTLMEKISMVDALGKDQQQAIFKIIDLTISNKKTKDDLSQLIAQ